MSDVNRRNFSIGPVRVGAGAPVYVIAEAGVNHDGQISSARELIRAAAQAGANAVKFQVFSANRLVTRNAPSAAYQQRAIQKDSQYEMLRQLELTHEQFADLKVHAERSGVEFLATPFSVEDLKFLLSIGVRAIKLASPDIVNRPLLEAANTARLPVIASTGAAEMDEIARAVQLLKGPLALLHCVSSYPAPEHEANLAAIRTLSETFDCVVGYSDHTESIIIGGHAVAAGARVIEKHLTLDRHRKGPDHAFSLEPAMMTEYVRHIRTAETYLGSGRIELTDSQREIRRLARSSVVAACAIHSGQELTRAMLTTKRPGGGISPMDIDQLVGRRAKQEIAADTLIVWDALE